MTYRVQQPYIDQDYRYKSAASQIPYDAGLTPVRTTEIEPETAACETVILQLLYGGRKHF